MSVLTALSIVVALATVWNLRMTGITIANSASCGYEEHQHEDACLQDGMPICGKPPHIHNTDCYSNPKADVETPLDWQNMFADYPLTGVLREDLVGIAKTQVGYTESQSNFEVSETGERKGYTRYGAWYGSPYGDWSAMFISFCLNFAEADPEQFPNSAGAASMAELWKDQERFIPAGDYIPCTGDIVFFDNNTAGIVTEVNNATFCVICGDLQDAVTGDTMPLNDPSIVGWGSTETPAEPNELLPDATEPSTEATEPSTEATEPSTEATEPSTEVTEPSTEATEPSTEATEPSTEATAPSTEATEPSTEVTEPTIEATEPSADDLLDISHGPVFHITEGGEATQAQAPAQEQEQTRTYSLRSTRSSTDLIPYLQANGGSYFFTLLDFTNTPLPKDDDGNYIVEANRGYKLTLTFNSPNGFLPGTYEYQIPNGLMVDGGEGEFILTDGTNVGTWVVTDTGHVTIVFNEHINSRTNITISATLGIHFPEQEEPIDFDGLITVKVAPPMQQTYPTILEKWGNGNEDTGKLHWQIVIQGRADSQIPGNILTDQPTLSSWSKPHSYTQSDMDNGLTIGASDPAGGWHTWTVTPDDPHIIWEETGWSYKMPKTVTCAYCGELELGNDGWYYYIDYTSTPSRLNTPGTFAYENKVTIDGQTAWGWSDFTHGQIEAILVKNGTFVSDAAGGGFLWEVQATIPGRPDGERAIYSWFISDEMRLLDANGAAVGRVQNDSHLSTVTATYNGTVIQIPRIQDATDQDLFAWDNAWTATENGISYNRTINLLMRCQCTPETCHWTGCGEYWFQRDDGTWAANGFCQCWTETQEMTFTFVYKTEDASLISDYGSLGYKVNNHAQLYYMPDSETSVAVSYDDATVTIPNLFEKQLTQDFNGYTAHYKITVNESKIVLTNGTPLMIHDVMTDTLAYISGSLVITAENALGHTSALHQGADYTVTYDGTGEQTDAEGNKVHVLDIVILNPQPVMYTLDYEATLIMPEQITGGVKYSNSATITLWGEYVSDNAVEKVYADINIAAKSFSVEMYKTCALTGVPLPGATFGLYNAQGGLITSGVTDANGKLVFQTNIIEGIILQEHTLYYLQEIQPPPAYQLDDTKQWFCFCNNANASCIECTKLQLDVDAVRIPLEEIAIIDITNAPAHVDLPSTGGIGTPIYMLCGLALVIGPLVYGFSLRRRYGRRSKR